MMTENSGWVAKIGNLEKSSFQFSFSTREGFMVRSPGFEPGSSAWEADVLAKLDYDRLKQSLNL